MPMPVTTTFGTPIALRFRSFPLLAGGDYSRRPSYGKRTDSPVTNHFVRGGCVSVLLEFAGRIARTATEKWNQ